MSLNSYDSANYSYNSSCAQSTNEAGSTMGKTNEAASSTENLDRINYKEEPQSLPILQPGSSKSMASDNDSAIESNSRSNTSVPYQLKSRHKRTGSNLSDTMKISDSDHESS